MADQAAKRKPTIGEIAPPPPERIGPLRGGLLAVLTFLGEIGLLSIQSVGSIFRYGVNIGDLVNQMAAIGADSIWIILTITCATGAVFAFYVANLAVQIGFSQFVGGTLSYGFLNELGPVLGGVALAARSGAAIAAEIGSMVVTEQVDALRAMAVSPVRYLVVPRVLAAIIMLPLLTVLADLAGLLGGMAFAGTEGVPYTEFLISLRQFVQPLDLINGMIKALVFGYLIGIIACQQGLRTRGGATGVGRSTTSSVVLCVVMIFLTDVVLAQVLTQRARNP